MKATVLQNNGHYLVVQVQWTGGIETIDLHSVPVDKARSLTKGTEVDVKEEDGNPLLVLV